MPIRLGDWYCLRLPGRRATVPYRYACSLLRLNVWIPAIADLVRDPAPYYAPRMATARFSNETVHPLQLMVEPWGAIEIIPPGSHIAIHYPAPPDGEDTSFAEYHAGMLRFWCQGSTYELDVDGVRIAT